MRGQKSRKGNGGGVRPGFEGGQTPLYRRLPKFVGKPMKGHTKTEYELVKIATLNELAEGSTVDYTNLLEMGLITKANKGRKIIKVLGGNEGDVLTVKGLTVKAHAFTESAKAAIEANGGTCILMSPTTPVPLEESLAAKAIVKAENLVKLKALRRLKAERDLAKAE
jgi:large subunit ribosomal protein L15